MRHFGISSSSFEAQSQDVIEIETFGSMIGREMEAKA